MKDTFGRTIDYLRVSITDRCNFRCIYCMPPDGVEQMNHLDILRYDEIIQITKDEEMLDKIASADSFSALLRVLYRHIGE